MQKWHNTSGITKTELIVEDGVISERKQLIPITAPLNTTAVELEIHWLSSGYHEPASRYGGSDHMGWPAEGEETRELEYIEIKAVDEDGKFIANVEVDSATENKIFSLCRDAVDQTSLRY